MGYLSFLFYYPTALLVLVPSLISGAQKVMCVSVGDAVPSLSMAWDHLLLLYSIVNAVACGVPVKAFSQPSVNCRSVLQFCHETRDRTFKLFAMQLSVVSTVHHVLPSYSITNILKKNLGVPIEILSSIAPGDIACFCYLQMYAHILVLFS